MLKIFEPLHAKHVKPRRPSQIHIVQPGETLGSIASMHGMDIMELCVLNNIYRNNITPGIELVVNHMAERSKSLSLGDLKVDENQQMENLSPQPEHDEEENNPLPWWYKASKRMKFLQLPHKTKNDDYLPSKGNNQTKHTNQRKYFSFLRSQSERIPTYQEKEKEVYALPKLIGGLPSDILSNNTQMVPKLEACLPMRCREYDWQLLYSSSQHGSSLHTLMRKVREHRSTLIVIETCAGEIFGGFASSPWTDTQSYYGTGECFVFTATPKFEMYSWKRSNTMFMLSNDQSMAMGGGGGFAWYLNSDLSRGTTSVSETFMNRTLASTPEFDIANVEVWGFVL